MQTSSDNSIDFSIAIIGAGFSGLGAAIRLIQSGVTSIKVFEQSDTPGGTWRDNTYPGCGCDIPSLLYSYSFEPNPTWSRAFSKQDEILNYIKHCVKKYNLDSYIQYETTIKQLTFDEEYGQWSILDSEGQKYTSEIVISAAGPFNAPYIPKLKGIESFSGVQFHSMNWDHNYDLSGKNVAVIGTGASAIQFIPEIAKECARLDIYQRTPPWIAPKMDKPYTEKAHRRFTKHPWYQQMWRDIIYYYLEYRGKGHMGDQKMRAKRKKESLAHLHAQIQDPDLRSKLTPDYEIGCKRVLISDNYYPTLTQDHVNLKTEGIKEITSNGIIQNDGKENKIDAIIYGTGFYTTEFPKGIEVIGIKGQKLLEEWAVNGPEAYYGMTVSGYPNLLYMVGPNSGLGHNSIIHMMESQINYILDYLKHVKKNGPGTYFNLKKDIQKSFNDDIQESLKEMVWSNGGCKSYYLVNKDGRNSSIWPGSTIKYRKLTKKIKVSDYLKSKGIHANNSLKKETAKA